MANDISKISCMETKCTGCGACVNVCPRGAIELKERNGYFLFPEIDAAKCNHCGLCLKKCPAAAPRPAPSKVTNEVAYGCYVKDEVERARSSSGGFFQALAKYVLRQGGAVCGASFTHGCHLEHVIITDEKDLPPLQRSKYLQSNPGMVYSQIKELLQTGKKVLFVGTPCQVAALKSVIGGDNNNLITVDLLCHGVPPENLFRQHLDCLSGNDADNVSEINFRDKQPGGWNLYHLSFVHHGVKYCKSYKDDVYLKGFANRLTIRRSCGDCRYSRFPRQGDFTLGDLWTVAEAYLGWMDNKGVNAMIVNTEKARGLLKSIRVSMARMEKVPITAISKTNNLQWHSYLHPNSLRFFSTLYLKKVDTIHPIIEEYLRKDDGICVLNFHDGHANYGSVLTAYAIKEKIKMLVGYDPIHIHLWSVVGGEPVIADMVDFNREEIPATELIYSYRQLVDLNMYFRTFIVGPDTVWRDCSYTADFHWFLFNFVRFSKNICSYAASFGFPYLANTGLRDTTQKTPSESEIVARKRLMKRFSHISVREDSGVKLCKEFFDVEAEHVLDSVFLLNESNYTELIGKPREDSGLVVRYILSPACSSPELRKAIENTSNSISLREGTGDYANRLVPDKDGKLPTVGGVTVRDWLRNIRDCKYFVSDSFHGICFAIIFRKQFVALKPSVFAGTERVDSLFRMLGIPHDRYAYTPEDYERILASPLDYSKIEPRLNEWIAKSEEYLKRILADNKPNRMRDWLESVEMLAESALPPPRVGVKRRIVCILRNVLLRLRNRGVITVESRGDEWKIGLWGMPMFTILRSQGKRVVKLWGVRILSLKR